VSGETIALDCWKLRFAAVARGRSPPAFIEFVPYRLAPRDGLFDGAVDQRRELLRRARRRDRPCLPNA
jgi:hypothetical protein